MNLPPKQPFSIQQKELFRRIQTSAVAWSWLFNCFRLASGLVLLPLVLIKLPTEELGMYYVLLSLTALVPLADFGFGPSVSRFVSYAMGGAESIQAQGVPKTAEASAPNYPLLWELLLTTQTLYRFLSVGLLIILALWGTYVVELRIHETASPGLARAAWAVTAVAALFDIYSNWWVIFLRGMNEVQYGARLGVYSIVVRLVVASALLILGFGLLSLPIGSFLGSFLQRWFARRRCLATLPAAARPETVDWKKHLDALWPNTWRTGVLFVSGYLSVNANTAICLHVFGLAANAEYGLTIQLFGISSTMATIWTSVKWPIIGQYRARHDFAAVLRVLRPRVWLQSATFIIGAAALIFFGPRMLSLLGVGKQLLPLEWMLILGLNTLLEMQYVFAATLISTENKLPYLWPAVAGNVLGLGLSLVLAIYTSLSLGALVLGPLVAGSLFNYWYWPGYAMRRLGTSWFGFLFRGEPGATQAGFMKALVP